MKHFFDLSKKFDRYCVEVMEGKLAHPEWRQGQAHFNVLCDYDPEAAEEIRGTELDPFYVDSPLPVFLESLAARWAEQ